MPPSTDPSIFDVIIVGAGLSGIGAARHLQTHCPDVRWAILEGRDRMGGTWDLFRYPGVRSDSDMYTLGYAFKPWTQKKAMADGPSILRYLQHAAHETGVDQHIRYGQRVTAAHWSDAKALWTLEITPSAGGTPTQLHTRFFWMCGGYYRYEQAHRPQWEGEEQFQGTIVHPQFWPEHLDYAGKRVVVIGSGATAVTLVPAMALPGHAAEWGTEQASGAAAQVTLLQRSPTYMVGLPAVDPWAKALLLVLPATWVARLMRVKNIAMGSLVYRWSRKRPESLKRYLLKSVQRHLHDEQAVAKHFTPRYNPWDQRLCAVPGADLFKAIRSGQAEVVTDTIKRFTPEGLLLSSGRTLLADIIVTATGLQLSVLADIAFTVNGQRVDVGQTLSYKGVMLSGLPNMAATFGYANASWTLKADLTAGFVCRLLKHMQKKGHTRVVPVAPPQSPAQAFMPLESGYVQRSQALLPKQSAHYPWRSSPYYWADWLGVRWGRWDDGCLRFSLLKIHRN